MMYEDSERKREQFLADWEAAMPDLRAILDREVGRALVAPAVAAMVAEATARLNARTRRIRRITLPILLAAYVFEIAALITRGPGLRDGLAIAGAFGLGICTAGYVLGGVLLSRAVIRDDHVDHVTTAESAG